MAQGGSSRESPASLRVKHYQRRVVGHPVFLKLTRALILGVADGALDATIIEESPLFFELNGKV